ncbi:N-acetylneuraminate synthase family protein [Flavobacteriaceae bacterium]|nr:N-acetylneuraminate synthase family protein [Flavobacteriaceae bacterium]
MKKKTYFIADISANHDGDFERAKKLCLLAKKSGADAAKFQHFKAETIVSDEGFKNLGGGQSHQSKWNKSVFEVYKDASVPLDWTPSLKKYCDEIEIDFFTTPYDLDYVDELDKYVEMFKIGSGDITWHEMLRKVALKGKKVLIASGASEIEEVQRAMSLLLEYNIPIVLMQCNTNYTAEDENYKYLNLNVLKTFASMYPDIELGLSDHTVGDETVLGAVALGACYIEKHFTDDNSRIGPDHPFSMNPKTWKDMVDRTRRLELALGSSIKKIEFNEKQTQIIQRRSIRLTCDKKKGEKINIDDIYYVRPCPPDALPIHINPVGKTLIYSDLKKNDYLRTYDIK